MGVGQGWRDERRNRSQNEEGKLRDEESRASRNVRGTSSLPPLSAVKKKKKKKKERNQRCAQEERNTRVLKSKLGASERASEEAKERARRRQQAKERGRRRTTRMERSRSGTSPLVDAAAA